MKNALLVLGAVILLTASIFAQTNKDSAAIRKVMDDQASAWNRGDIETFMIGYWRSDKLKFVSGDKITYGWRQTLENYKRTYGTPDRMGTLAFSDLEIDLLSKDAAFVTGSWQLKREKDALKGKFTLLWRKIGGRWLVVADHSS